MQNEVFSLPGYEGAAIYHERIGGDPARALDIVEQALARLEEGEENKRFRITLSARRERLRLKAMSF